MYALQPNATREEIEDVARMAFSHEFIMSMADGYDTEVPTTALCIVMLGDVLDFVVFK